MRLAAIPIGINFHIDHGCFRKSPMMSNDTYWYTFQIESLEYTYSNELILFYRHNKLSCLYIQEEDFKIDLS